jgi:hypothetical protein
MVPKNKINCRDYCMLEDLMSTALHYFESVKITLKYFARRKVEFGMLILVLLDNFKNSKVLLHLQERSE